MTDAPPCLSCGTCCFSSLETYVRVTGDDYARLGEHAEELTTFVGHRCFMRMHDGHCAALTITPEGQFVCTVYERRPATCRELERGSPACDAELELKADRAKRRLSLVQEPEQTRTIAADRSQYEIVTTTTSS